MSNLDNLISKIAADGDAKASEIIANAEATSKEIVAAKKKEAEAQKNEMVAAAQNEAELIKSQLVSAANIEMRDSKLKAKQEIISQTFQKAIDELKQMDNAAYTAFLETYIPNMPITGSEEIIVPDKYKSVDLSKVNEKLKSSGKSGEIKLFSSGRTVDNGFILVKDGFENNNTFESLLDYYRDELEKKVVEILG